jgi:hypothetical protein
MRELGVEAGGMMARAVVTLREKMGTAARSGHVLAVGLADGQLEATMRYALLIYSPLDARGYAAPASGAINDMVAYTRTARDAGVLVAAEQLTHTDSATSVRVRGGDRLLTDGPFMETKEHLLGFFLIDVPGLDTALEWAARLPPAAYGTVEVRAAQAGQPWQAVLD